jgi:hypothetical protein
VPQTSQRLGEGALGAAEEVQGLQIRQEGVALNKGLEEGLILAGLNSEKTINKKILLNMICDI